MMIPVKNCWSDVARRDWWSHKHTSTPSPDAWQGDQWYGKGKGSNSRKDDEVIELGDLIAQDLIQNNHGRPAVFNRDFSVGALR